MLSRLTLLACLLVYMPQDLSAVEDLIFESSFEGSDPLPLPAPSELIVSASSTTVIDLVWTDNASTETGFTVEHSTDGSNWTSEADVGADVTVYSDTALSPASTHYYRVRAFDAARNSNWSNVSNATTNPLDTPSPVDYVAFADQLGSGEVFGTFEKTHFDDADVQQFTEKLSGGMPRNETTFMGHFWKFNIEYGDVITVFANAWQSASSDDDNFLFSWSEDDLIYNDLFILSSQNSSNVDSGSIPNFVSGPLWIRVIDTDRTPGNNKSRDSLFVDHLFIRVAFTGPPTVPDPPSVLAAVSGGKTSINLSWTDNSNSESGFRLDRSPDGVSWSFLVNLGAKVEAFIDNGLTPSTNYFYRIRAFNDIGPSSWSNTASATTDDDPPPDPPAAPSGLIAITSGSTSIDLSWVDNADNESSYTVERRTAVTSFEAVAVVGPNTIAITNGNLASNTEYFYRVFAVNADGDSAMSNVASATTLP